MGTKMTTIDNKLCCRTQL